MSPPAVIRIDEFKDVVPHFFFGTIALEFITHLLVYVLSHRNDLCYLEPDQGPCTQQEASWYFDRNSNRCQSFVYGGCEGNANRFNTEEQCERQCGDFRGLGEASLCYLPSLVYRKIKITFVYGAFTM